MTMAQRQERPGSIGDAVGDDAARRARNVADVNGQLYDLHDAGALPHFEHRQEPARHDARQLVDVWELTFANETRTWTYTYAQVRALLRGWRLAQRHGRAAATG